MSAAQTIQGVSQMFEHILETSSSHQNKKKKFIPIYDRKHLFLVAQPPRSPDLNPLDFYLWGHLKLWLIQVQYKMKGHSTNGFLIAVKVI